jgi:hypothetical protein
MNAGVVLRPTKPQLKKLASVLEQLLNGGFDLLNEEQVHLLIYGPMKSIPDGYKELVMVMDDILKTAPHHDGSTYQQVGGTSPSQRSSKSPSQRSSQSTQSGGHIYAKRDSKIYLTQ